MSVSLKPTANKRKKMDTQTVLILLLIGLAAGVLSGVIGIGGGIVIVPALVYFIGFSQRTAQGTSLAILLLPIGLLGVIQFYKAGYVDIRVTAVIALAFFIGSYFGSRIALTVPQEILKKCFAVLIIIIGIKMLFFDKQVADEDKLLHNQTTETTS
ncbi:MAG: sulfite exporter TauE/SafE family protein [Ferruginibacter sp.]